MLKMVIHLIIMDIVLNIRLKLGTEGMLCCELSWIRPALLRKDNSFKPLPVGKLAEILALPKLVYGIMSQAGILFCLDIVCQVYWSLKIFESPILKHTFPSGKLIHWPWNMLSYFLFYFMIHSTIVAHNNIYCNTAY